MIRTENTANMNQFLIADANSYGLKAGKTLAASQQASAKKLDPEILNKHLGETDKFFEGKDTKFTSLTEEEDKKSVTASEKKEERVKTETNQEIPAYSVEETIEAPEGHSVHQEEPPQEILQEKSPEPPITADTISSEAASFIQWHQNSFSSLQEATDEYVEAANMTDHWSGIDILRQLASIDDPEQRAAAKKDLSDIYRRLSPENIDIPLGRGEIIKDVFMAVCETEDNKEKELVKDMAIAHIKASSDPIKGMANFKFVQSCKNPDQSLKEASDDFLEIENLSGDEFQSEIINIYRHIGSINDRNERILAKNDAVDIFKKLGHGKEREGREIFDQIKNISDGEEKNMTIDVACEQVNAAEDPATGMINLRFVRSWTEHGQTLKEVSDEFLSLLDVAGNKTGYSYSLKQIFNQIFSITNPVERAMAKDDAISIFKGIGKDRGNEGKVIFEEIRKTSDTGERKKEIEIACAHMKAVNAGKNDYNIGAENFIFVKNNKQKDEDLKDASDRFLKILSSTGNHSMKAREIFLQSSR